VGTVSVIIPSYRYGALLEGCVRSVLDQRGVDVEILIVDDCSPDDTADVARRLAAADPRVAFRRHEVNRGLIATANEGLEWAAGDYVLLLSADDVLVPGCLARAAEVMEAHPQVGLVYGRPLYAREGEPFPVPRGRWRGTDVWVGAEWIARRCRTGHNCISSPEAVVRTSVQRAVGGYDAACTHTSDLNLWLRIAAVADVAYVRGAPQAIYRIHAGSMLRSQEGPMVDLRERRLAFDRFLEVSPMRDPAMLRRLYGRALARQALWQASRAYDRGELGEQPVDELIAFALDVCPDARRTKEWHGLRLRRRIGAGRSIYFPPFVATGAAHRLRSHAGQALWRARGV
jgi:Glycosyl transferase family 2